MHSTPVDRFDVDRLSLRPPKGPSATHSRLEPTIAPTVLMGRFTARLENSVLGMKTKSKSQVPTPSNWSVYEPKLYFQACHHILPNPPPSVRPSIQSGPGGKFSYPLVILLVRDDLRQGRGTGSEVSGAKNILIYIHQVMPSASYLHSSSYATASQEEG